MDYWKEVNESMDRINNKLDLILELVNAKKAEDWNRVDEVCKKLDAMKRILTVG
jgi:c-di-GMP-related signal transduction protein